MSKIAITIELTEAEFKRMVKRADATITDEAKFLEILRSKKFAERVARDMVCVWRSANEDGDELEVLYGLGLEKVIEERDF